MERLWAPWRTEYVTGLAEAREPEGGCFLCYGRDCESARDSLVLGRGEEAFIIMNRYPYNTGHLMVACNIHRGNIEEVPSSTAEQMWQMTVICKEVLMEKMNAHGCNIGINQGRCAGAGVTDHLHIHIVPRWEGDANFMPVIGQVKVMSQSLENLYDQLLPAFASKGITPEKES